MTSSVMFLLRYFMLVNVPTLTLKYRIILKPVILSAVKFLLEATCHIVWIEELKNTCVTGVAYFFCRCHFEKGIAPDTRLAGPCTCTRLRNTKLVAAYFK